MKKVTIDEYTNILKNTISKSERKRLSIQLEQAVSKTEIKGKIIEFFKENPYPKDSIIHDFAEQELGLEPDKLETIIYELLTDYIRIGNVKDSPDSKFDMDQLNKGEEVEFEHAPEKNEFYRKIARSIAKDHLNEIGDYYTRLDKMEKEAKGEKGIKD